jgi:hypothetical protein
MDKKKIMLYTVLVAIFSLFCMIFASCEKKDTVETEQYNISWTVSDHVSVTVDGYDDLPKSVNKDSAITFTVTPQTGWQAEVRVNRKALTAQNGKYSFTAAQETTNVVITESEIVSKLEVKLADDATFYAGNTLDKESTTVTVTYGTGKSETLTNYTVNYQNGSAFSIGDTSFSVTYGGVKSDAITIPSVEALVVIDPNGGSIATEYEAALKANSDLHNVTTAKDGVISFTFTSLKNTVDLPTAEQVTRGDEGDFTFLGWSDEMTSISADATASVTCTANYSAHLLDLEKIYYENRTEKEEQVPYLIISGKFRAAQTAYLYLYEGNDNVELIGDTIGGENTKKGDKFELTFDMRKLVEAGYEGKWMDIKFCATFDDKTETMEINLKDYADDFVNTDQLIVNGNYSYSFEVYENTLKAKYAKYSFMEYSMSYALNEKGEAVLTISGVVDKTYAGKVVKIDWWTNQTTAAYSDIDADGKWSVSFNMSDFPLTTSGYAHFAVIESKTDETVLWKDGSDGNLLNEKWSDTNLTQYNIDLIENSAAIRIANGDGTRVFYVGKGKWGGIVLYGQNEALMQTTVDLQEKNGKAYVVICGTYGENYTAAQVIEELKKIYTNMDWMDPSWKSYTLSDDDDLIFQAENGQWKVFVNVSKVTDEHSEGAINVSVFAHYGESSSNLEPNGIKEGTKVVINGITYELGINQANFDWDSKLVTVKISSEEDSSAE